MDVLPPTPNGFAGHTSVDSTAEHRLRRRLDLFLMTYAALSSLIKSLDQSNYTYAYVSGMKEDLSLYGNELTWFGTTFSIGYIIGALPGQLLLIRLRPSIVLPVLEIIWGIFVLAMACAKSARSLYAIRFLIGLFESAAYPGLIAVMASWYVPSELGKRVAILHSASSLGSMCAGYLQVAVFTGLDGTYGIAGWQWLFIVNGCVTVPVGALGLFMLPDSPANSHAKWLTHADMKTASARLERVGRAPPGKLTKDVIIQSLTSWPLWMFALPYILAVASLQAVTFFSLWLKATQRYSTVQVNLIPSCGYAFGIVTTITYGAVSDAIGSRWPLIIVANSFGLFGAIVLTIWDVPFGLHFVGFLSIFGAIGGTALQLAWVSEATGGKAETRKIIIGAMTALAYVGTASLPFVMFPAVQAPHYKWGYQISLVFWVIVILATVVAACYTKRRPTPFASRGDGKAVINSEKSSVQSDRA